MYQQYPAFDFLQRIEEKLNELTEQHKETLSQFEKKMTLLEEENIELRRKVEDMKPVNIENINYKIQELAVEEISGTLNIGMSTFADSEELKRVKHEILDKKMNSQPFSKEENNTN